MKKFGEYAQVAGVAAFVAGLVAIVTMFVTFFLLDGWFAKGLVAFIFVAIMAVKIRVDLGDRRRQKRNETKWMKS